MSTPVPTDRPRSERRYLGEGQRAVDAEIERAAEERATYPRPNCLSEEELGELELLPEDRRIHARECDFCELALYEIEEPGIDFSHLGAKAAEIQGVIEGITAFDETTAEEALVGGRREPRRQRGFLTVLGELIVNGFRWFFGVAEAAVPALAVVAVGVVVFFAMANQPGNRQESPEVLDRGRMANFYLTEVESLDLPESLRVQLMGDKHANACVDIAVWLKDEGRDHDAMKAILCATYGSQPGSEAYEAAKKLSNQIVSKD